MSSINDRLIPKNANDRSIPYTHWWPKQGSTEWITYTFAEKATIQRSTVYWYDDQPWQGCKIPDSWKLYYKDGAGEWKEVSNPDQYPVQKGVPCTVNFDPVETTAVKLEVQINKDKSAGLYEWEVE